MFLGINISLVGRLRSGGALSAYAVAGFDPALVFDFDDEYYRTGGTSTDFTSAITHSRTSNATMVDSDGLLKWGPHNLLTYSEQFDNANWNKTNVTVTANATTAPDGTTTADKIVETAVNAGHAIQKLGAFSLGLTRIAGVWVKAAERTRAVVSVTTGSGVAIISYICVDLTDGSILSQTGDGGSVVSAGDGWYLISLGERTVNATSDRFCVGPMEDSQTTPAAYLGDGSSGVYVWGAHGYRSDLGGMVNNPDRNDSYVPTTSSARYLPRRGHHVYNGSAWVNEGVLHESESRVNLVTYSDLSSAWIIQATDSLTKTANAATGPDGNSSLHRYEITDTTNEIKGIYHSAIAVTAGATYTTSFIFKNDDQRYVTLRNYRTTSSWSAVTFDLQAVTVTQETGGSASTSVKGTIEDLGGGLYRCAITSSETGFASLYPAFDFASSGTPTLVAGSGEDAYAGTSGVGLYASYAQLEAASTPSSYIPNAGATSGAIRAAETLTIPAANLPWPTPNVIGAELVTNGGFTTNDLTGWTDTSTGTGTVDASSGAAALLGTDASNRGKIEQAVSVTAGKLYRVTFDVVRNSGALGTGFITTSGAVPITTYEVTSGSKEYLLVAPAGAQYFAVTTHAGGGDATIDNVSVREIDPLAVSIQMQGRMTRAVEDGSVTAMPIRWSLDGNNQIRVWTDSSIAGGGVRWDFDQEANTVIDQVSSGYIDPFGINVPFNIASRHGSTFINGAVDGTALTANTTPTALPDLSATDLNLGFDYMGTIKLLRIWAADLDNSGIALASATAPVITGVPTIGVS